MWLSSLTRFIFSVLSAVCAGAAAACTMCFQLNVFVPMTVDYSPSWHKPPSLSSSPVINNALLLALFYLSHSLLARDSVKQILHSVIPESLYRPIYVLSSAIFLMLIVYCWQPFGPYIWKIDWVPIVSLLWVVNCLNLTFLGLAFLSIDPLTFIGILLPRSSSIYSRSGVPKEKQTLVQTGLYQLVRHPMYTGVIVSNWAVPVMTCGHLMFSLSSTAYMWLAVLYYEEPNLIKTFGTEYNQYVKKTPRFIPTLRNSWRILTHSK